MISWSILVQPVFIICHFYGSAKRLTNKIKVWNLLLHSARFTHEQSTPQVSATFLSNFFCHLSRKCQTFLLAYNGEHLTNLKHGKGFKSWLNYSNSSKYSSFTYVSEMYLWFHTSEKLLSEITIPKDREIANHCREIFGVDWNVGPRCLLKAFYAKICKTIDSNFGIWRNS